MFTLRHAELMSRPLGVMLLGTTGGMGSAPAADAVRLDGAVTLGRMTGGAGACAVGWGPRLISRETGSGS